MKLRLKFFAHRALAALIIKKEMEAAPDPGTDFEIQMGE